MDKIIEQISNAIKCIGDADEANEKGKAGSVARNLDEALSILYKTIEIAEDYER